MNFEDLKIIWDEEGARPSCVIDEQALHRIVVTKARSFRKEILWRDMLEIGIAGFLVILFLVKVVQSALDGRGLFSLLSISHFLLMGGVAFVGISLYGGRQRQKTRERGFDESIHGSLQKHISHVSYQIRLLSNVVWWYLLPLVPGVVVFVIATADSSLVALLPRVAIILLVFGFVLWLNKRAVRKHLIPQEQELESLLSRLEES